MLPYQYQARAEKLRKNGYDVVEFGERAMREGCFGEDVLQVCFSQPFKNPRRLLKIVFDKIYSSKITAVAKLSRRRAILQPRKWRLHRLFRRSHERVFTSLAEGPWFTCYRRF